MKAGSPLARQNSPIRTDQRPLNLTFGHLQLKTASGRNAECQLALAKKPPLPPAKCDPVLDFPSEVLFTGNLEDYSVGRQVGQGAYAIVRLGLHKPSNTKVAIKTYDKVKLQDPRRRKNVYREVQLLQQLQHPHCIRLREAINSSNHIHIIMEYAAGASLRGFVKRKQMRRVEEVEARRLFEQVVRGIQYCHGMNIAHRDLKMENILLDESDNIKIIDFGFATRSSMKTKAFCGTPSYMAPEIVERQDHYDLPADIWALGVLLYALLTGSFPFKGLSDKDLYKNISRGTFDLPDNLPAEARSLIGKMLSMDPEMRPTCREILAHAWVSSCSSCPVSVCTLPQSDPEVLKLLVTHIQTEMGYSQSEIATDLAKPGSLIATLYKQFKLQIKHLGRRGISPHRSAQSRSSSRPLSDKEN